MKVYKMPKIRWSRSQTTSAKMADTAKDDLGTICIFLALIIWTAYDRYAKWILSNTCLVLTVSNPLLQQRLWKCKRLRANAHSICVIAASWLSALQALYRPAELLALDYLMISLCFVIWMVFVDHQSATKKMHIAPRPPLGHYKMATGSGIPVAILTRGNRREVNERTRVRTEREFIIVWPKNYMI